MFMLHAACIWILKNLSALGLEIFYKHEVTGSSSANPVSKKQDKQLVDWHFLIDF